MKTIRVLPLFVASLLVPACQKPAAEPVGLEKYSAPLPPGVPALRLITDPADMPDFASGFHLTTGLHDAARRSLHYLSKPSSQEFFPYYGITHQHAVASIKVFLDTLDEASNGTELNRLIRERFDVYASVGYDGSGVVLFTGYYQPIFDARLQPDAEFRYPLYRMPEDLVKDRYGNTIGHRRADGTVAPGYHDRATIEAGGVLAGRELCWLRDPFEAYIVTVQGCARLRLADGSYFEIGYAANNGHPYRSIGKLLIERGRISADELSLSRLMAFFKEHPEELAHYTAQNPRYVFFQSATGGPRGSLNEKVTPYRTIATDKDIYPRGCVAFITTQLPDFDGGRIVPKRYAAFALDQDAGGAIRAPGRCDVFLGTGDRVGVLAGRTAAEGRLYYVFLKHRSTAADATASVLADRAWSATGEVNRAAPVRKRAIRQSPQPR